MFITNIIPVLLLIVSTNAIGIPDEVAYNRSRFERATDKEFSTSIKQMEMISRVTNGISLRQGLSRGSITNEELISDLLNLGDVKPSDIKRIDTEKLKKLVESLQKLRETILQNKRDVEIEESLDQLSYVAKTVTTVEKVEKPGKEFLDAVSKIRDSNLKWRELNIYTQRLRYFWDDMNAVATADVSKLSAVRAELLLSFERRFDVLLNTEDFKPFEKELPTDVMSNTKKHLEPFSTVIATVNSFSDIQNNISYNSTNDDATIQKMEKSIVSLAAGIEKAWESMETIAILEELLIYRRHRSGSHDPKLIPAFLPDISGLDLVLNDLKDSWLQTEVKGQANILEQAFQQFGALKEKTKKADEATATSSIASLTEINLVSSQVKYLARFSYLTGVAEGTLKPILSSSVEAKTHIPNNRDKFENLYKNIVRLYNHLISLRKVLEIWKKFGEQDLIDKLNKIRTFTNVQKEEDAIPQIKSLRKDESFQYVWKIMNDVQEHIGIAGESINMTGTAKDIADDYDVMDPYVQKVNKFLETIKPMKQFSKLSYPKSVFKNIETIKRAIEDDEFGAEINVDPVIVSIENTQSAFKELDDTINSMKQAKGSEIDGLVGITDASESARNIGLATKAVSSMKKFLELDTSKLDAGVDLFKEYADRNWNPEDKTTMEALAGLVIQISNVKKEIKSFKDSVQPITSSKLSDYSEIFEKAKSVKGISRDFLALSVSVGNFVRLLPEGEQLIGEIKDLLVNMDKLCLAYSKYQTVFDESKNTLNNIDLLFTNLQVSMTATTPSSVLPTTTTKEIRFGSDNLVRRPCKESDQISVGAVLAIWMTIVYIVTMSICTAIYIRNTLKARKKG